MSHVATSRILEDIILQLNKDRTIVPEKVLSDLKSARVLMQLQSAKPSEKGENAAKIEQYLGFVEAYLINEAAKRFPPNTVDDWLKKLELATCEACVSIQKPKMESKFIPGIPRDQKWVRARPIESLPLEKLEQMATETNLQFREEKGGHLIVFGKDEDVKEFVKKMTAKAGKKTS